MDERHRAPVRLRMAHLGLLLVLVGLALGAWLAAGTRLRAQPAGSDDAPLAVTQPALSVAKDVTPTNEVPYHGVVTYSVVLGNGGPLSDTNVLLTDTLPAGVDFSRWVQQPPGAEVVADELTWSGTVTAGQALTFTFVVSHVGGYGDVVTNTARFSGTLQTGEDSATFTVVGRAMQTTYLPLAIRTRQVLAAATYGGAGWDSAHAIQQTADGGYIVAGETESLGSDAWVLKLDADGSIAWQKTYGGTRGTAIQQTAGGGYVVAGYTDSYGAGWWDAWVLKLNADGSIAWQKTYGDADWDYAYAIEQTVDGGYVVAGRTESYGAGDYDAWVLKLNADGSVAWQKTYGGVDYDRADAIRQTADGGYVVAGCVGGQGWWGAECDAWVLKLNADGGIAWQKTYGGAGDDYAWAIQQTADGGYVVAGETESFGAGGEHAWVFKLNAEGSVAWQKTYSGDVWEFAFAIEQTGDGGFVVAGTTPSFGSYDAWVLKLNADGNVAWQKTYGGMDLDHAYAIQQTADGGYVVAGEARSFGAGWSDAWVLKLEADGSLCAGCELGEASSALTIDVDATVADSDVTVLDSNAMVVDIGAAAIDTYVIPDPICACPPPSQLDLSVTKAVTPTTEVSYHGAVTYTVVLGNAGPVSDTNVLLTDPLPAEVDFDHWVEQPPGAEVVDDELSWQGTVTAGQALTFTFVVSHVGDYGDMVVNTAHFNGTRQTGSDDTTFSVAIQNNQILVAATYGGADSDRVYAIQQTVDGGYIVAGETESFGAGGWDAWVLKLDADGSIAWQKTYGWVDDDHAYAIEQTGDGGYVVVGWTEFLGGDTHDAWVLKLEADGSIAWQKTYGKPYSEFAYAIQQTADGGYVVAGYIYDVWILKLNADGSIAWQKAYGWADDDEQPHAIQQTADGGYVVVGETESFGAGWSDAWVLKLNADGSIAWQKTYGGVSFDYAYAIEQTSDGGYVVAGWTESFGAGDWDVWVLKLNADGSIAWQKTYGGTDYDRAWAIEQTADGGYVVVGWTGGSGGGGQETWVLKLNDDGSVAWQRTYGESTWGDPHAIQQTADGGYVVGHTGSFGTGDEDVWVLKLDADGGFCAGCELGEASSATVADSNATVADSDAMVADSDVITSAGGAAASDTYVTPDPICACPLPPYR